MLAKPRVTPGSSDPGQAWFNPGARVPTGRSAGIHGRDPRAIPVHPGQTQPAQRVHGAHEDVSAPLGDRLAAIDVNSGGSHVRRPDPRRRRGEGIGRDAGANRAAFVFPSLRDTRPTIGCAKRPGPTLKVVLPPERFAKSVAFVVSATLVLIGSSADEAKGNKAWAADTAKTTGCAKKPGSTLKGGTPPRPIREIRSFRGISDPGSYWFFNGRGEGQ